MQESFLVDDEYKYKFSDYSLLCNENPRVVLNLTEKEYKTMRLDNRLVNIKKRSMAVAKALKDPNLYRQIVKNYNIQELEDAFELEEHQESDDQEKHHFIFTFDDTCYRANMIHGMVCFRGAEFITKLFMLDNPLSWDIRNANYDSLPFRNCGPYSILDMRGVFVFEIQHSFESHGFVLYITDEDITVYNTYGGYTKFYVKKFSRLEWVTSLVEFFDSNLNEQKENYHKLWGFTRTMVKQVIGEYTSPCVFDRMLYAQIL